MLTTKDLPKVKKGDRLFAVITWQTPYVFLSGYYRPKPYFVLEIKAEEINPNGTIFFTTKYMLTTKDVFVDLEQAKRRLVRIFEQETSAMLPIDKVRLVSQSEEDEAILLENRKIHARTGS